MLNVAQRVHDLLKQDGVQTSVEIYFIADTVDCTDDTAVKASQTVLSGSDIEMNGGCAWMELHNREEDFEVGEAVSSTFSVTLENSDGHLNNFAFGRCKVYANLYDSDNDEWISIPMGVYIMNTPVKRRVSPIQATAYDQMVLFDKDAADWWDSLDFTDGLTLSDILTSLATYCGVSVKNASSITNGTYSYTEKPFDASEMTCRDVLAWIAGAAAGNARFDRNGYLEIKKFGAVDYSIDYTTSPTICLEYDIAEYSTPVITRLQVAQSDSDIGAIIGNDDTTSYRMIGNGFMRGESVASVMERATPIYNALVGIGTFSPIQTRVYADITVESGDVITFGTERLPIFQQMFEWHGSRFQSTIMSSGNAVRPEMPYAVRMNYKEQKEFYISLSEKVGDSEIIAKINLSPEEAKIIASKISLIGYVTVNNGFAIDTDGKMTANGATINGSVSSSGTGNGGTPWTIRLINGVIRVERNGQIVQLISRLIDDTTISTHEMRDLNGTMRYILRSDGKMYFFDENGKTIYAFWRDGTYRNIMQIYDAAGNARPMIRLIADDQNGQMSLEDINGIERNYIGAGRVACYDASGNETVRLSSDKSLKLGSTTLTEAGIEKLNGIGTTHTPTPSGVTLANSTITTVVSQTLTTGLWLVSYRVRFPSNATGLRKSLASLTQNSSTSIGMMCDDERQAVSGDWTYCAATFLRRTTAASETIYINASQNSGASMSNVVGRLQAVRIG